MDTPIESRGATDTEKKMCLNKIKHTTAYSAYLSIAKYKLRGDSREKRVYPCPFCKAFHVTTKEKQKVNATPEYMAALLKRQGFDSEFSSKFSKHLTTQN